MVFDRAREAPMVSPADAAPRAFAARRARVTMRRQGIQLEQLSSPAPCIPPCSEGVGGVIVKRVLVAGATGYLGGFVVRELKARGDFVRALARSLDKLDDLRESLDETVQGEVTRPDQVNKYSRQPVSSAARVHEIGHGNALKVLPGRHQSVWQTTSETHSISPSGLDFDRRCAWEVLVAQIGDPLGRVFHDVGNLEGFRETSHLRPFRHIHR